MYRKRRRLKYRKERALLSDVLPYEVPVTFTNRHFYVFVLNNNIELISRSSKGQVSYHVQWLQNGPVVEKVIRLLFGLDKGLNKTVKTVKRFGKQEKVASIKLSKQRMVSIPFSFQIRHKRGAPRELTICHPRNQIQVVDFYYSFKELILYYSNIGSFSIRRPNRIAKFSYYKDKTHYDILSEETVSVEEDDKEYESLRSYFAYKDYSNIHKFYESYRFHRAEKKYDRLVKLDITRCFDSIYTHSISWAFLGKGRVKANVPTSLKSFGGQFDALMQCLNYNETNGIVIGPEFSRIFAELILQTVDLNVEKALSAPKHGLVHKRDYEVFRYVDDYFIFFNEDADINTFVEELQICLSQYKLYLNQGKQEAFEKPIITALTIAKLKVANLLDGAIKYQLIREEVVIDEASGESETITKGSVSMRGQDLISRYKAVLSESSVEYKDIVNFTLAIVDRRIVKLIRDFGRLTDKASHQKALTKSLIEILDFTFFIYSVAPRVNTTIKLCRVIRFCTAFCKGKSIDAGYRERVFKEILDNVIFVLRKNRFEENTQVETLYLLIALAELGKGYWLTQETLCEYLGLRLPSKPSGVGGVAHGGATPEMNYFTITVILFYIKDKQRYAELRQLLQDRVVGYFSGLGNQVAKSAEATMLLLDMLTCPYIDTKAKRAMLTSAGYTGKKTQESMIGLQDNWFTTWKGFDLGLELELKHSQDVY